MAGAEEVGAGGAPGVAPDPAEDAKSSEPDCIRECLIREAIFQSARIPSRRSQSRSSDSSFRALPGFPEYRLGGGLAFLIVSMLSSSRNKMACS